MSIISLLSRIKHDISNKILLKVKIDLKKCLTASVSNIISFLIKEMVSV